MNKVHLRIVYGADERYSLVRNTLLTHYKYFDSTTIVNSGPDENSSIFNKLIDYLPGLKVYNYGRYQNLVNDLDQCRIFSYDIPDGEWVLYLDSDWRLPEYFLKNMKQEISKMENEGFNHLFSYQIGHHLGDGDVCDGWTLADRFNFTEEKLSQLYSDTGCLEKYGQPILQRVDKKNQWMDGFIGNHNYFLHVPYNKKLIPPMYHFHFRDFGPKAYCGSMILLAWWYMGHHVFSTEEQLYIQNSWEYRRHEQFKDKHKCWTSNQLMTKLKSKDEQFMVDLRKMFLSFDGSKIFCCQQMYDLASKYNMEFYKAPEETPCTGICCLYDGKYIKDYPKI